jgi:phenylalanyl-tRNA synthetase alpha chain
MSKNKETENTKPSETPEIQSIIDKLSPIERKVVPFLNLKVDKIMEKSGLEEVTVLMSLKYLEAKGVLNLKHEIKSIIDLGTNGIYYKKHGLPERQLLTLLESGSHIPLEEAQKSSKLSDNEFKAALGALKKKALVNLSNGKISLNAKREEVIKKSLEEQFLDMLPLEKSLLSPEMAFAFNNLNNRKDIIETKEEKIISITLTGIGKSLAGKEIKSDLIEELTPEIIKNGTKGKKFRHYDISAVVPSISGGKRHFVNQSIEYAKKVWTDLGFKEMTGPMVDASFWVFDALFTPQDHPAREMQDTFFIANTESALPDKKIVENVKKSHELGVAGSKGWKYSWKESIASKPLLRTHTTSLSARTISTLKPSDLPAKFFAIGKVFRNETVDWKHGFEFYQSEGIVVDPNASFTHLLGYLKEFYKKMGYDKIKFVPSFFAYTEPSVEVQVWHSERKEWVELGGAGMFRPEVTMPLLGKPIPILAWGQGFDRIITEFYKIKDLRELYNNNIKELRQKKFWTK